MYGRLMFPCRVRAGNMSAPAIMLIVDSKNEIDMNVAFGFPDRILSENDVIISDSIYNLLEPID